MEDDYTIPTRLVRERMKRIRSQVERLERLKGEIEALERLTIQAAVLRHGSMNKRFGPTQAVISVVRSHPRHAAEIVNLVADHVDSKSRDVKRTLFTTIGQMREKGRLIERSDGTLDLAENVMRDSELVEA